jgi:hypothetical protein
MAARGGRQCSYHRPARLARRDGVGYLRTVSDVPPFFFERTRLGRLADAHADAYAAARPFPHATIDDFLPPAVTEAVVAEFPAPDAAPWTVLRGGRERKLVLRDEALLGPRTRQLYGELRSSIFVRFLETLTGMQGLIPSPHLDAGGGLYQIEPGCCMPIHADFNRNERLGLDRCVNLMLYLNHDWREEWGGHLELWSPDAARCERRILPVLNRCVVFATGDHTLHGHPEPLACPPGRTRKSLVLYYYAATAGAAEEIAAGHGTLFRHRPGERPRLARRRLAERLLPPIARDAARWLRRRLGGVRRGRLEPAEPPRARKAERAIGLARGDFEIPPAFFEPLPREILERLTGGER